jgi:hypothetical protein
MGKSVDREADGEVRSEPGYKGLFHHVTSILPTFARVGNLRDTLLGASDVSRHSSRVQNAQNGKTAA